MTAQTKTPPSVPFDFTEFDYVLRDPEAASAYLEDVMEDDNPALFQQALKDVARAQAGGMASVAEAADVGRESLYKSLSENGNPKLSTITKVLGAMGLKLSVTPIEKSP